MSLPAFQILDKNNNPIAINQLDEEICKLLNIDITPKKYAVFRSRDEFSDDLRGQIEYDTQTNWYDSLGWMIATGKNFQDIIEEYNNVFKDFLNKKDENGNVLTLEVIIPGKMKVLNYWINSGYTPKSIKNV